MQFTKATKTQSRARIAFVGPAGSGKTYSALRVAKGLAGDGRVAVICAERGSAGKYADEFDFDMLTLESFSPDTYVEAIHVAEKGGYAVLIIDGLSPAWSGKGGALELVDQAAKRAKGNSYAGWRDVTPKHNAMVDAILASPCHIIATLRSKTEYVLEERNGKQVPRKVGMAPIQRDGLEYEFDVVGEMNLDHEWIVSKTRARFLTDAIVSKPGEELGEHLRAWLTDGAPIPEPPPPPRVNDAGQTLVSDEEIAELQEFCDRVEVDRGAFLKWAAKADWPELVAELMPIYRNKLQTTLEHKQKAAQAEQEGVSA